MQKGLSLVLQVPSIDGGLMQKDGVTAQDKCFPNPKDNTKQLYIFLDEKAIRFDILNTIYFMVDRQLAIHLLERIAKGE